MEHVHPTKGREKEKKYKNAVDNDCFETMKYEIAQKIRKKRVIQKRVHIQAQVAFLLISPSPPNLNFNTHIESQIVCEQK